MYNRMFWDAWYSFSLLKFYYEHMIGSLRKSSSDFQEFTEQLEVEHKKRQESFNKQDWLRHYDVYSELYPRYFNNSFIISACALFEYQIKNIYALIRREHKLSREWDDEKKGSVPFKAKMYLWHGGIFLKDDPPGTVIQQFISTAMLGGKYITTEELWRELENYFRVRNCIAHHNGLIQKLRYPQKVMEYASEKGILLDNAGHKELLLNQDFNGEMCDNMGKFFEKLMSAYYSTPLPE